MLMMNSGMMCVWNLCCVCVLCSIGDNSMVVIVMCNVISGMMLNFGVFMCMNRKDVF